MRRECLQNSSECTAFAGRRARSGRSSMLAVAVFVLAVLSGCTGVVERSSNSNPPPAAETFAVSGKIAPAASGAAATVVLSGAKSAQTTADGSGNFSFTGLANGTYTLTPGKTGFTFTPTVLSITVNSADATGADFAAAAATAHAVTLNWNPSVSAVVGYNIYRGTVSGGSYVKLNGPLLTARTYKDTSVQSGTPYFYVTTAVDALGNESAYSNEVRAAVP